MAAFVAALAGCGSNDSKPVSNGTLVYTSPQGLEVWGAGPGCSFENSTGTSSDGMAWNDRGYATWDDVGKALEDGVAAFALAHPTIAVDQVWTSARTARYYLQDDYVFIPGTNVAGASFAAGSFMPVGDGRPHITLALWTRGTTETNANPLDPAGVPPDAPPWTVRSPSFSAPTSYPYWRYGTKALAPALEHELGNFWGLDPD